MFCCLISTEFEKVIHFTSINLFLLSYRHSRWSLLNIDSISPDKKNNLSNPIFHAHEFQGGVVVSNKNVMWQFNFCWNADGSECKHWRNSRQKKRKLNARWWEVYEYQAEEIGIRLKVVKRLWNPGRATAILCRTLAGCHTLVGIDARYLSVAYGYEKKTEIEEVKKLFIYINYVIFLCK